MLEIPITIKLFTTKIPTDRKLDVVAKVSDKRKGKAIAFGINPSL